MSAFSKFPAELVLHVFQFLPISSLHAMAQLSRNWYDFSSTHQSVIYHQAALLHQFVPNLNVPLSEAKKAHFGSYLNDETDWRGFCHRLFRLHRNWAGEGSAVYRMSTRSGVFVHRIKVDERAGFLITTHMMGGIKVVDLETDTLLWHLPEAYVRSWAHCEYQNGFLIFDRFGEFKEVWRLASDFHLNAPPVNNRPDDLQLSVGDAIAHRYRGCPERGQFKPWALIQTSEWGRAFRFVYPILLVAAEKTAYLYDVRSANLVQTIKDIQILVDGTTLGDDIYYVEVNDSLVFICATNELRAFHRSNGALALRVPRKIPQTVPCVLVGVDSSVNGRANLLPLSFTPTKTSVWFGSESTFVAVHVHGNDLVALRSDDCMLLVRDFPSLIKGERRLSDIAIEIRFSKPPMSPNDMAADRRSIYVAFEHGHVGVVTSSGLFVFTIDGTSHCVVDPDAECTSNHLKGTAFPHLIGTRIIVNDPHDLYQVVSCLQMTETGIYVTLDHRYIPALSQKGKQRQSLEPPEYRPGTESEGENDSADENQDESVIPVGDMDEAEAIPATTADGTTIRGMLLDILQPQENEEEEEMDDEDDEPITIHTAHVNTEDEDHIYEEDDHEEGLVDLGEDLDDEPECHSVVWVDYSPR